MLEETDPHSDMAPMAVLEWHGGSGRGSRCYHGYSTFIPTSQNNLNTYPTHPLCNTSEGENCWEVRHSYT